MGRFLFQVINEGSTAQRNRDIHLIGGDSDRLGNLNFQHNKAVTLSFHNTGDFRWHLPIRQIDNNGSAPGNLFPKCHW